MTTYVISQIGGLFLLFAIAWVMVRYGARIRARVDRLIGVPPADQ